MMTKFVDCSILAFLGRVGYKQGICGSIFEFTRDDQFHRADTQI